MLYLDKIFCNNEGHLREYLNKITIYKVIILEMGVQYNKHILISIFLLNKTCYNID